MEIYVDFSKKISDEKIALIERKYATPAIGWKDGYYHPRQPEEQILDKNKTECSENGLLIKSDNWKETGKILGHDTGSAGIFEYNETTEIKLSVDNANYEIDYCLVNPCLIDHSLDVYVNDIYEKTVLISGKASIADSLITAICADHLTITFASHDWATKREETKGVSFYLKDIRVKRQVLLEKRTKPRIFIISDSTAQSYNELQSPQAGWGQCLPAYFKSQVPVIQKDIQAGYPQAKGYRLSSIDIDNWSIGARSTKSFIQEGKFKTLLQRVHRGDIALIQWATNDASASRPNRYVTPTQFGGYLKQYVNSIRVRGALPILITPPARLLLDQDSNRYPLSFTEYREQYLKIADENNCLLIDLDQKSADLFNSFGTQKASINFMQLAPYNYGNFSEGIVDATHFQFYGADQLARLISQEIYEMLPPIRSRMEVSKLRDRNSIIPEKLKGLILEEHQDQKYVFLQWQRSVDAEYYLVKRSDEKCNETVVGTTTLTNYSDLTIQQNGSYRYLVVPCNQEVEGIGESSEIEYHCADNTPNLKAPNLFEIDDSLDKDKVYFSLRFNGMPNIVEYNICYQSQTATELNGILESIQQVDVLRLHSYFLPVGKYKIWIKAQMEDGSFIVSPEVEL